MKGVRSWQAWVDLGMTFPLDRIKRSSMDQFELAYKPLVIYGCGNASILSGLGDIFVLGSQWGAGWQKKIYVMAYASWHTGELSMWWLAMHWERLRHELSLIYRYVVWMMVLSLVRKYVYLYRVIESNHNVHTFNFIVELIIVVLWWGFLVANCFRIGNFTLEQMLLCKTNIYSLLMLNAWVLVYLIWVCTSHFIVMYLWCYL